MIYLLRLSDSMYKLRNIFSDGFVKGTVAVLGSLALFGGVYGCNTQSTTHNYKLEKYRLSTDNGDIIEYVDLGGDGLFDGAVLIKSVDSPITYCERIFRVHTSDKERQELRSMYMSCQKEYVISGNLLNRLGDAAKIQTNIYIYLKPLNE